MLQTMKAKCSDVYIFLSYIVSLRVIYLVKSLAQNVGYESFVPDDVIMYSLTQPQSSQLRT